MDKKELLKTIISDSQSASLPELWPRTLEVPVDSGKIVTLTGVRRSGKTYHLFEVMKSLKERGVSANRILYINFEDERLRLRGEEMDLILQAYRELYPELDLADCYFFFDEIQEVDGWELFIDRLYRSISRHVFVTGSNSKLLSREIATALRGRTLTFEVYPLSFFEYINILQPGIDPYSSADQARFVYHFERFMQQGGFPAILLLQEDSLKQKELQAYFDVMLLRDLVERYGVSQVAILRYFCKRVIGASAGEFSVNKVYLDLKSQNYKISKDTLYGYQENVEAIYLSRFVAKYDESVVKSESAQKKPYVIDQGMGAALDFKLSQDRGRLLETTIALELMKYEMQPTYYQDGAECDFIVSDRGQVKAIIQVSADIADEATRQREMRGLIQCCKRLGLNKGLIVTFDTTDRIESEGITIEVVPAWQYCFNAGVEFVKERENQRIRDAHFYENGVRADGTGGVPPEES